jgi:hypothetical protein
MTLTRSKDRKVTNAVNKGGNAATIANAFGIPAGNRFSCPGMTSFCERICYANKLEKIYSGVKRVMVSNFEQLLYAEYMDGISGMANLLSLMVRDFRNESLGKGAPLDFRIHWDGDFFSVDYAKAWREVVEYYPDVRFWVYTRSFTDDINVLPIITGLPNLAVYLSADPVNMALANQRAAEYPGTFIATVADTFADAKATILDTARKTYPCPENGKRIPLISKEGSACIRCGICPDGRGDVLFSVKKR